MSKVARQTLFGLLFVCTVSFIQLVRSWAATANIAAVATGDGAGNIHLQVTSTTSASSQVDHSSSSLEQSSPLRKVPSNAAGDHASAHHVEEGNTLVSIPSSRDPQGTCFISSYGKDGIGHQLEAKLSCIATAMALNMTYVHQPMDQAEHESDTSSIEKFLGLNRSVPILGGRLWDDSAMRAVQRYPLPKTGDCPAVSWFDSDISIPACQSSTGIAAGQDNARKAVFSADNCWDYFYCTLRGQSDVDKGVPPISALWQNKIGPTIRQYVDGTSLKRRTNEPLQGFSSSTTDTRNKLGQSISIRVVAHVRRGSGRARHLPLFYYSKIIRNLETAAAAFPMPPRLDVVIHTNIMPGPIRRDLTLKMNGTSSHLLQNLRVFGKDSSNITIQNVLEDIMSSDIFIASESSLSHVGGLLRFPQDPATVLYPQTTKRIGLAALGWNIVQVPKGESSVQVFRNKSWAVVGNDFWTTVIAKANTRKYQILEPINLNQ